MAEQLRTWSAEQRAAGERLTATWEGFFKEVREEPVERVQLVQETARIAEVQEKHTEELLALENVVGVAVSLKVSKGKPTRQLALTVFVEKKQPDAQLAKGAKVPREIDGVVTDVVEVGLIEPLVFNARVRPALPGYSIGHHNITAGTFGCLVRDIRGGGAAGGIPPLPGVVEPSEYLILSNNHVLADVNAGKPGDLILQPGPFDGGTFPSDGVAVLDRFVPIVFGLSGYNLADAAVARPTFTRNLSPAILGIILPTGVGQAFVGGLALKVGRTTQVTVGRILAVNATINVFFGAPGVAQFRRQIVTTAMAAGGDSGSALLDSALNVVGLLFAGSPVITIHNNIAEVETALGVRPLTAPRAA
jgi:hypothetical protein